MIPGRGQTPPLHYAEKALCRGGACPLPPYTLIIITTLGFFDRLGSVFSNKTRCIFIKEFLSNNSFLMPSNMAPDIHRHRQPRNMSRELLNVDIKRSLSSAKALRSNA